MVLPRKRCFSCFSFDEMISTAKRYNSSFRIPRKSSGPPTERTRSSRKVRGTVDPFNSFGTEMPFNSQMDRTMSCLLRRPWWVSSSSSSCWPSSSESINREVLPISGRTQSQNARFSGEWFGSASPCPMPSKRA